VWDHFPESERAAAENNRSKEALLGERAKKEQICRKSLRDRYIPQKLIKLISSRPSKSFLEEIREGYRSISIFVTPIPADIPDFKLETSINYCIFLTKTVFLAWHNSHASHAFLMLRHRHAGLLFFLPRHANATPAIFFSSTPRHHASQPARRGFGLPRHATPRLAGLPSLPKTLFCSTLVKCFVGENICS